MTEEELIASVLGEAPQPRKSGRKKPSTRGRSEDDALIASVLGASKPKAVLRPKVVQSLSPTWDGKLPPGVPPATLPPRTGARMADPIYRAALALEQAGKPRPVPAPPVPAPDRPGIGGVVRDVVAGLRQGAEVGLPQMAANLGGPTTDPVVYEARQRVLDALQEKAQRPELQMSQQAQAGGLGKYGYQVGASVPQTSALMASGALFGPLGPMAAGVLAGMPQATETYDQLGAAGVPDAQAALAALLSGAAEGGFEALGTGAELRMLRAAGKADTPFLREALRNIGIEGATEAGTSGAQAAISNVARGAATLPERIPVRNPAQEALEAGIVGGLTGGVFSGVGGLTRLGTKRKAKPASATVPVEAPVEAVEPPNVPVPGSEPVEGVAVPSPFEGIEAAPSPESELDDLFSEARAQLAEPDAPYLDQVSRYLEEQGIAGPQGEEQVRLARGRPAWSTIQKTLESWGVVGMPTAEQVDRALAYLYKPGAPLGPEAAPAAPTGPSVWDEIAQAVAPPEVPQPVGAEAVMPAEPSALPQPAPEPVPPAVATPEAPEVPVPTSDMGAPAKRNALIAQAEANRRAREGQPEAWQMPLATYAQAMPGKTEAQARSDHRSAVRAALQDGLPVPPEVLADYPDLQPAQPATATVPGAAAAPGTVAARNEPLPSSETPPAPGEAASAPVGMEAPEPPATQRTTPAKGTPEREALDSEAEAARHELASANAAASRAASDARRIKHSSQTPRANELRSALENAQRRLAAAKAQQPAIDSGYVARLEDVSETGEPVNRAFALAQAAELRGSPAGTEATAADNALRQALAEAGIPEENLEAVRRRVQGEYKPTGLGVDVAIRRLQEPASKVIDIHARSEATLRAQQAEREAEAARKEEIERVRKSRGIEDVQPSPAETATIAADRKKPGTTGFTPSQRDYLTAKLHEATANFTEDPTTPPQRIHVPKDGDFTVSSAAQAEAMAEAIKTGTPSQRIARLTIPKETRPFEELQQGWAREAPKPVQSAEQEWVVKDKDGNVLFASASPSFTGARQTYRIAEPVTVTNTQGKDVKLPAGEEYTVYPLGDGKVRLQDGKQVTVFEGELEKLAPYLLPAGEQPMAGGMIHDDVADRLLAAYDAGQFTLDDPRLTPELRKWLQERRPPAEEPAPATTPVEAPTAPQEPRTAPPAPQTGERVTPSQLTHATSDVARDDLDVPARTPTKPQSEMEWKAGAEGLDVERIIEKAKGGQALEPTEHARLAQAYDRRKGDFDALTARMEQLESAGARDEAVAVAEERENALKVLVRYLDAADMSGTAGGRSMRARQMFLLENQSAPVLIAQAKKEKGSDLTAKETAQIEAMAKQIATLEAEARKARTLTETQAKEIAALKAQAAQKMQTARRQAKNVAPKQRADRIAKIRQDREQILNDLKNLGQLRVYDITGLTGEASTLVTRLAASYIHEGALTIADVAAQLRQHLPDLTEQQILEAIGTKGPSPSPEAVERGKATQGLRQEARLRLSGEMQKLAEKQARKLLEGGVVDLQDVIDKLREVVPDLSDLDAYRAIAGPDRQMRKLDLDEAMAKAKRDRLKADVRNRIAALKPRTAAQKAGELVLDAMGLSTAMAASGDVSAVGRQGLRLSLAHPIVAARTVGTMFKAMANEAYAHEVRQGIEESTDWVSLQEMGVEMSEWEGADLGKREEGFVTGLLDWVRQYKVGRALTAHIPPSSRAYSTFLNVMRKEVALQLRAQAERGGHATEADLKAIGNYINVVTGRGNWFKSSSKVLSRVFWAPRLALSQFEVPFTAMQGSNATKLMVAGEMAKWLGATTLMLILADLSPWAEVEKDPRSSEFGQIRIGPHVIDPWAGMRVAGVFSARFLSGQTVRDGQERKVAEEYILGRFMRSKLGRLPGLLWAWKTGKDFAGNPSRNWQSVATMPLPLSWSEIYEAGKAPEGAGTLSAVGVAPAALAGLGATTYSSGNALPGLPKPLTDAEFRRLMDARTLPR